VEGGVWGRGYVGWDLGCFINFLIFVFLIHVICYVCFFFLFCFII
jgi:hypothetical protein